MTKPQTVIIYRLGSLGDTVVALPCFHLVAEKYASCRRILLTNAPAHAKAPAAWSVLGESGLIHGYISYPVGTRNILELGRLYGKMRAIGADTLIYLTAPRGEGAIKRDERFFRFCGVKEIIGVPRGEMAIHNYDTATNRFETEASRLARCVAPLGNARLYDPKSWDLLLTADERGRAAELLCALHGAPFLALGIGCKKQVTDWGVDKWKALMPELRRRFPQHALVFIGAKEDQPAITGVAAFWPGKSLNLGGELSPRESAAIIECADLFLGPDSGPMHLAESVGTPSVSIFSAHKLPGMWFPVGHAHEVIYHKTECFGCNLDVCHAEKKKCITSISVEEVVHAAARLWERTRATTLGPSSPGGGRKAAPQITV